MKRTFLINLVLLLLLNLLVKPFWVFGIDRTVQNIAGSEDYGFYFSLLSFSFLFNMILDPGITNFNNRSIAQDQSLLPGFLSTILPLKLILGIFYAVVCLLSGLIIGYSKQQFFFLSLLICNNFLSSIILYLRSNISGLHFFKTDSILSVLDRLIMIILCSIILWGKITDSPFRMIWFVYIQTVSYGITAIITFAVVLRYTGMIVFHFSFNHILKFLKSTLPYALLLMLMSVFSRIDSVMIERILPDGREQAGIYAQSFRILDAVSMFAFLFAGLLLPIFSKMLKADKPPGQLIRLSFSLLMIPALTLVIISQFYGVDIIELLYREHLEISARIYMLLIISLIFISVTYIIGTLLTANGNLKELNILAGVTVIINICLNVLLIPEYKAAGAAMANVSSHAFFAISQIILAIGIFKFNLDYSLILRYFSFIILLTLSGSLFHTLSIPWAYGLLFLLLTGMTGAWILRIITPKGLYEILNQSESRA